MDQLSAFHKQLAPFPDTLVKGLHGKPSLVKNHVTVIVEGERNDALNKTGYKMLMEGVGIDAVSAALHQINKNQCQPPLAPTEVETIVFSLSKATAANNEESGSNNVFEKAPRQSVMVNALVGVIGAQVRFDELSGEWMEYSSGIWSHLSNSSFQGRVAKLLEGMILQGYSDGYLSGVINLLKLHYRAEAANQAQGLIPMQNGVLNPLTRDLHPHSPEYGFTWCLPYDFDPEATCPGTDAWLDEALNCEDEIIELIRAFMLATVLGRHDIQKFLELVGPGGTGKSTLICLLQHLIGVENSVPTDLKNLEQNRFEAAGLYRKKLAVITDSSKYGGTLDKLKAITGGDPIRLERKYRQQGGLFTFTGLVIIAGNEVIQSVDYTSGLSRRRLTIVMSNRVEEAKRDPDLLDKLCSELPGILNWVLALDWKSAREILRNTSSIGLDRSREVQLDTNPIAAWADECLVHDTEAKAQIGNLPNDPDMFEAKISQWLYVSYVHWCRSGGYRAMAIRRFSSLLCDLGENLGYDVAKCRDAKGNKISGLRLRSPGDVGKPSFVTNFVPPELGI